MVAFRRDRLDVDSRYVPSIDLPIRCPFFLPVPTLPDQRHGSDRFPLMAREYRDRFAGKLTANERIAKLKEKLAP